MCLRAATLAARRACADPRQLSVEAAIQPARAGRTSDRGRARHPGAMPLPLAAGSYPTAYGHRGAWIGRFERFAVHDGCCREGAGGGHERDPLQPAQLRRHRRAFSCALPLGAVERCGGGCAGTHRAGPYFSPCAGRFFDGRQPGVEARGRVGNAGAAAVPGGGCVLSGDGPGRLGRCAP